MKYLSIIALTLLTTLSFALASSLKRTHKNIVIDRSTTGVTLDHVVRRNPAISSTHSYGLPSAPAASSSVSFGANNDDNGPNLGGFGKTAAIASKISYKIRSLNLLPR